MSRNQKATVLASGFYVLAFAFFLWGAMVSQETRVTGTIGKRPIDIPVYLQNEPEYAGLKNTKVYPGWGGGRLILWGLLGLGSGVTGLVLSNERRAELAKEKIKYKVECYELDQQARLDAAYRVSLDKQMKERTGEAALTVLEDKLEAEVDANREINGWYAPEQPEPPRQLPTPNLKQNQPIAPLDTSPEDLKAQLEALAAAARDRLNASEGDRPESNRPDSTAADGSYQLYQERGHAIMDSMIHLKMSILNVAPTGAGKTHTMDKYLSGVQTNYPQAEILVIAQKNDPFVGLADKGCVKLFDPFKPEVALQYLDRVYAKMQERLNVPKRDRVKFDLMPIRLVLDDWYATYQVLKIDTALWRTIAIKLSSIITLGREVNVCLYIATQSYILAALGLAEDSNIRSNLAIICQGFIRIINGCKQGDFGVLKGIIKNDYIVPGRDDKERLASEIQYLESLSRLHQVPVWFSAIGEPTLALAPRITIALDGLKNDYIPSTDVVIVDRNSGEDLPNFTQEQIKNFREALQKSQAAESPSKPESDGSSGANSCNHSNVISNEGESNAVSNTQKWEDEKWYRWLPSKAEVLQIMEDLGADYNFAYLIRNKLKKTEAAYNRKARGAIVQMLLDLQRFDLIEKFEIDPQQYPYLD